MTTNTMTAARFEPTEGTRIRIRPNITGKKYLTADFPGWGAENYADHLEPLADVAYMSGTVVNVVQHGSAPYTRYCLRLANGGFVIDAFWGDHFDAFAG